MMRSKYFQMIFMAAFMTGALWVQFAIRDSWSFTDCVVLIPAGIAIGVLLGSFVALSARLLESLGIWRVRLTVSSVHSGLEPRPEMPETLKRLVAASVILALAQAFL